MTIFLVTDGCYDDNGVVAAFTTKNKAEKFIKEYSDDWGWKIEELLVDPENIEENDEFYHAQALKTAKKFRIEEGL